MDEESNANSSGDELLTIYQAARRLDLREQSLYRAIRRGRLEAVASGQGLRVWLSEARKWAESREDLRTISPGRPRKKEDMPQPEPRGRQMIASPASLA